MTNGYFILYLLLQRNFILLPYWNLTWKYSQKFSANQREVKASWKLFMLFDSLLTKCLYKCAVKSMNSVAFCGLVRTWSCDSVADFWLPLLLLRQTVKQVSGVIVFSFKAVYYSLLMNTSVCFQHKNWNKALGIFPLQSLLWGIWGLLNTTIQYNSVLLMYYSCVQSIS